MDQYQAASDIVDLAQTIQNNSDISVVSDALTELILKASGLLYWLKAAGFPPNQDN